MIYDVAIGLPGLTSPPEQAVLRRALEADGDVAVVEFGPQEAVLGACEKSLWETVTGADATCELDDVTGWKMRVSVASDLDRATVEGRVKAVAKEALGTVALVVALARQAAAEAGEAAAETAADVFFGIPSDFASGAGKGATASVGKTIAAHPVLFAFAALTLGVLLWVALAPSVVPVARALPKPEAEPEPAAAPPAQGGAP